jgi:hypothetical protein
MRIDMYIVNENKKEREEDEDEDEDEERALHPFLPPSLTTLDQTNRCSMLCVLQSHLSKKILQSHHTTPPYPTFSITDVSVHLLLSSLLALEVEQYKVSYGTRERRSTSSINTRIS